MFEKEEKKKTSQGTHTDNYILLVAYLVASRSHTL